ncbi:hypothetical protein BK809_0000359 [Diplodia seriata]|uniref:C2H2-type domain-containing protein n=1 Tax=Diplodia seriata TaxID=420778 RepID=A0A1S8B9V2_9PEZI|nr:hypothetical protein BK809_0000359 [Diplodia seriata]
MTLGIFKLRYPRQIPWLFTRYRPTCSPARTALLQPQACHFHISKHIVRKREKAADAPRHHSPSPPPPHPGAATCPHCGESCRNLVAHVKREHGTATIAPCPHCKRSFRTGDDLAQHVSGSHPTQPVIRYACPFCPEHSFKTRDGLDKHVRLDHPRRELPLRLWKPGFSCGHCPAVFKNDIRLARHVTAEHPPPLSPLAPGEATPLDAYFEAHRDKNDFCYDRRTVPSHSFNRLRKYLQWEGDELVRERRAFSTALREELVLWFGGEEVHALHRLSRALGARNHVPYSVRAFIRNLQDKYINLIDLLHWARHERDVSTGGEKGGGGVELEPVKVFESLDEFWEYSSQNSKGLPREFKGRDYSTDEGNLVLWRLLRFFPRENTEDNRGDPFGDPFGDPVENNMITNNVSQGEAGHGSEKKEKRQGYAFRSIFYPLRGSSGW